MATRRQCREWAVQLLFTLDFNRGLRTDAYAAFWNENKATEKAKNFTETIVNGVLDNLMAIDERIRKASANWDLSRIGTVERNVLRMAVYEMLFRPDIPPVVSINEAVDIAKYFGNPDAGKFVNGLLDGIAKTLNRPARTAATSSQNASNERD